MPHGCPLVAFFVTFLWHFFQSLKQNFIAYRSSKVSSRPDCIFEIHQLWHLLNPGWEKKQVHNFPKSMSWKVNTIPRLRFELLCYEYFSTHTHMHTHTHVHTYIYIYIYIKMGRSTKRFEFFSIYLFISFLHICFQLDAFVTEHIWHKTLLMGYSMRFELTRVCSLNGFHFVKGFYRSHFSLFLKSVFALAYFTSNWFLIQTT